MITENQAREVMGATAYSEDGEKIGKVGQVFLDDQSGRPEFVTVNTGFFGSSESFVPVTDASYDGERLTVPFSKEKVKDAPNVNLDDGHMSEQEEQRLFSYYGLASTSNATADTPTYDSTDTPARGTAMGDRSGEDFTIAAEGHDTSGPTTDDAMTRSEERLNVGTETVETGRARLRKYVTTEQETVTVPVRKERFVVETEPITDANRGDAQDGPAISEEEHEVVLHEERAVADKTVEAVERVRIGTETVLQDETVTADVRKEHIEVDDDTVGTDGLADNRV